MVEARKSPLESTSIYRTKSWNRWKDVMFVSRLSPVVWRRREGSIGLWIDEMRLGLCFCFMFIWVPDKLISFSPCGLWLFIPWIWVRTCLDTIFCKPLYCTQWNGFNTKISKGISFDHWSSPPLKMQPREKKKEFVKCSLDSLVIIVPREVRCGT